MRSLVIAFSMYSKIPMPQVEWDKRSLSWALVVFPLVGVVIGGFLALWLWIAALLGLTALGAAVALLLPIALSGGIHLDGFCDTCDALSSHQPRERKLEILKDSHTGAFAIICCCLYLLVFYAGWREIDVGAGELMMLALLPVLSRCLAALTAVSYPNARGSGLLATFTEPVDGKRARIILRIVTVLVLLLMGAVAWDAKAWYLLAVPVGCMLSLIYYKSLAFRQFGGVTGDTTGFFLQITECAAVVLLALAQKGGALL